VKVTIHYKNRTRVIDAPAATREYYEQLPFIQEDVIATEIEDEEDA